MKFFRWILSHLTVIFLLLSIVYVYWNRNEIWPEEVSTLPLIEQVKEPPKMQAAEESAVISESKNRASVLLDSYDDVDNSLSISNVTTNKPVIVADSSSDFSERMKQYRKSLPDEERKLMDSATKTYQHIPDEASIKYPDAIDMVVLKQEKTEELSIHKTVNKPVPKKQADQNMDKYTPDIVKKPVTVTEFKKDRENRIKVVDDKIEKTMSQLAPSFTEESREDTADVDARETSGANNSSIQTEDLQKQIRNRQRELENQMVMLIPLRSSNTTHAGKLSSKKTKRVKAEINTSEQRILLAEAREAFDKKNFERAEKKYKELKSQLQELPDIVGELANVYRAQNKITEYLLTNTQFVSRLVNHNRFNEAWKVVVATDQLDEKTAAQQRIIIKRKQEQL